MIDSTPLIELNEVSKGFGKSVILRQIDITVRRGETLVLIGESGCGKSLTTKMMAGLMRPSVGHVLWNGRDVQMMSDLERNKERLKIGYLFQSGALFDSMSVYDNIAFGLRQNTTLPRARIKEIVSQRIHDIGLKDDVCRKMPSELSGGMRKRIALARALALMPEIVLYDEPTTGLDPIMTDVINELIVQTKHKSQVTSIVVTHEMSTVRKVADRVIMFYPLSRLQPGEPQIIFEGTPEEAFASTDPRVLSFVHGDASQRIEEVFAA